MVVYGSEPSFSLDMQTERRRRRRSRVNEGRAEEEREREMREESVYLSVAPLLNVSDDLIVTLRSEKRG